MKVGAINFQIPNYTQPKYMRSTLPPIGFDSVSFCGETAEKISEAVILTKPKECLPKRPDGGFLVDSETNTVVYYGEDAKNYLKHTNYFPFETQIIAQSGCKIKAHDPNKDYELNQEGAIVINGGTRANVEVTEGNPLVVTCEKKPDWYEFLSPNNGQKEYFDKLTKRNKIIYKQIPKTEFQNAGKVKTDDLSAYMHKKLTDAQILNEKSVWADFYSKEELVKELQEKTDLYKEEIDEVVAVWEKSTKSGYDITGLVDSGDSIAVYRHKGKLNQFELTRTEWMTNSSQWLPKGASSLGVSRIYSDNPGTRAFTEVREQERIHKHQNPDNPNEKQTEVYILTQGEAVALLEYDGKENIKTLKPGDMIVVPAGVKHGMIAAKGEYEHLCIQTPSAFQYGFKFKSEQREFSPEMVDFAKKTLDYMV